MRRNRDRRTDSLIGLFFHGRGTGRANQFKREETYWWSAMGSQYFTQEEAQARVGRRVRTRIKLAGVPEATTGTVCSADLVEQIELPSGETMGLFSVSVWWDMPRRQPIITVADGDEECLESLLEYRLVVSVDILAENETRIHDVPLTSVDIAEPMIDWFTKDEYKRCLVELRDEATK